MFTSGHDQAMPGFKNKQELVEDAIELTKSRVLDSITSNLYRHMIFRLWTQPARKKNQPGYVMPGCISQKNLSESTGISRTVIGIQINYLIEVGLIEIHTQKKTMGKRTWQEIISIRLVKFEAPGASSDGG